MIKKFFLFLMALLILIVATPVSAQDLWKWKDESKASFEKVTHHVQGWMENTDIQQELQDWTTDLEVFFEHIEWKKPNEVPSENTKSEDSHKSGEKPAAAGEPIEDYQPGEFENEVVELVNEERSQRGLNALKIDNRLSGLANIKSQDMADKSYFSHTSPTYGSPFDMMDEFDFRYRTAGENIAAGQRTPEQVVEGWMNSDGHRANILHEDFTHIGVGYIEGSGPYRTYWTQLFMTPR